jgi:hypothetical protein
MDDAGERARHFAAAGVRDRAFAEAMRAVAQSATPGERAAHLELAALSADGPETDALRVDAADALAEAELNDQAVAVLDQIESNQPPVLAKRHLPSWARTPRLGVLETRQAGLRWSRIADPTSKSAGADAAAQARALNFDLGLSIARDKAVHALEPPAAGSRRPPAVSSAASACSPRIGRDAELAALELDAGRRSDVGSASQRASTGAQDLRAPKRSRSVARRSIGRSCEGLRSGSGVCASALQVITGIGAISGQLSKSWNLLPPRRARASSPASFCARCSPILDGTTSHWRLLAESSSEGSRHGRARDPRSGR